MICLTVNSLKAYNPVQLLFVSDIILLIKHKVYWGSIRQKNQTQINKDNIFEKSKIGDHN